MRVPSWWVYAGRALAVACVVASTGCSTLRYHAVQTRFEAAVRADNERFAVPFSDVASQYGAVAEELSPARIGQLDAKLRPNAWTLRAVSQWRAGELGAALASGEEGLAEVARQAVSTPQLDQGRDAVLLTMLPGLVEDSRLRQRWLEGGSAEIEARYADYAGRFRAALQSLTEAATRFGPATPAEVRYYWHYQCWRVLQNWSFVIAQLPLAVQADHNSAADGVVKALFAASPLKGSATLVSAMDHALKALPETHPYRALIELERQL